MVFAEYTLLTGIVILTAGLALYALGVPLVPAFYLGARVGAAGWGRRVHSAGRKFVRLTS